VKQEKAGNIVKLTLGSKDVSGFKDYPGTGFLINGTARYISSGDEASVPARS
jgi:hypothetical protein